MSNDERYTDEHKFQQGSGGEADALCSEWRSELARVGEELGQLAGASESEFLAIGARLYDFSSRSVTIADLANGVFGEVRGEETERAIETLHEFVRRLNEHLGHSEREVADSSETFEEIVGLLEKAREPLNGFKKINKVLRMLGIATKIESARLGSSAAGFETLAKDVERLSVQVIGKSGDILGQIGELEWLIHQTLGRAKAVEAKQRREVQIILQETTASLTSLTGINEHCTGAAGTIARSSAEIASGLGAVVTSMQFHDIVRQQLEHVQAALVPLIERLALESFNSVGEENLREFVAKLGDICELQAAQLLHSAGELASAVAAIAGNLRGIADQEESLAEDARLMAGMADTAGSSHFDKMDQGMSRVATLLAEGAVENNNAAIAMEKVAGTVGEIVEFVKDIENIGEEIELIAINAQIKAAHTGAEGAALGVLAESIQRLSLETMEQTVAVSANLRSVTDATERLSRGVDVESAKLEREIQGMLGQITTLLQSVRRVNNYLRQQLGEMAEMVQTLTDDLEEISGGMALQDQAVIRIKKAASALDSIVTSVRRMVPAQVRRISAESFDTMAERYTMQSERKVHGAVIGLPQPPQTGEAALVMAVDEAMESGLGDNVELF